MRKIPTVNPGCEWVLDGEGVPTRKYDGTRVWCNEPASGRAHSAFGGPC